MEQLMHDDDLRMRMGRAGRERVVRRQNYRTMAECLEQVYYRIVSRNLCVHSSFEGWA